MINVVFANALTINSKEMFQLDYRSLMKRTLKYKLIVIIGDSTTKTKMSISLSYTKTVKMYSKQS
jgi:hypothetical protein